MKRVWTRELAGWVLAAAVSVTLLAAVAASPRAELLFRDGDSVVVALAARSLLEGRPWDWAMSSVLFLPEIAVFAALTVALPFGVNGVLAVNAVLNLLGLYGALRLAAGRRRPGTAPVAWSLIALGVFGLLIVTEHSPVRDALEPASLLLTTTYYSAAAIAVVASTGVARRALDHDALKPWLAVALFATALISTLSNPLYAAWAAVPLVVVLALGLVRRRPDGFQQRISIVLAVGLLAGTGLGFLARIPFTAWIANTGAGYAQPERWLFAAGYYGDLLGERLSSPHGPAWLLLTLVLLTIAGVRTAGAADAGARIVASFAWIAPLLVVVGAIALGTHASRYLQPIAFAPVLALVAAPRALAMPAKMGRALAAVSSAALVVAGGLSAPQVAAATRHPDADLMCVTDWIDASGRTGAGQFWTARLPKLHLDEPARLVQVDHRLNGYAWLVNRTDFDVGEVSFLLEDARTVPWELPAPAIPVDAVDCGRYRILDFGDRMLPLGAPHS